jgi:hypothetical protein
MPVEKFTVLDHVENIRVPGKPFAQPVNEYWALVCHWQGLEFLYRQAFHLDQVVAERVNPNRELNVEFHGNHPAVLDIPMEMLTCAFHWYAISACQYVRTVGAIAYRQDPGRQLPHLYVRNVIPDVQTFSGVDPVWWTP